ncbi:hypothetical protein BpHYR1_047181 [Brachionus plicatilis]|uniref:Uncharacterized protein n=1 Tax=Brachionus plicatilis TaxID=10195 RepID=A0A3M7S2F1_BRAPC|nr:hypothetical protein BpHYR1_047181 [Brachionus plicatilis]
MSKRSELFNRLKIRFVLDLIKGYSNSQKFKKNVQQADVGFPITHLNGIYFCFIKGVVMLKEKITFKNIEPIFDLNKKKRTYSSFNISNQTGVFKKDELENLKSIQTKDCEELKRGIQISNDSTNLSKNYNFLK